MWALSSRFSQVLRFIPFWYISLLTALNNEVFTMVLYCKISTSLFIINKYLRDVLWFECEMSQASPCTSWQAFKSDWPNRLTNAALLGNDEKQEVGSLEEADHWDVLHRHTALLAWWPSSELFCSTTSNLPQCSGSPQVQSNGTRQLWTRTYETFPPLNLIQASVTVTSLINKHSALKLRKHPIKFQLCHLFFLYGITAFLFCEL